MKCVLPFHPCSCVFFLQIQFFLNVCYLCSVTFKCDVTAVAIVCLLLLGLALLFE